MVLKPQVNNDESCFVPSTFIGSSNEPGTSSMMATVHTVLVYTSIPVFAI